MAHESITTNTLFYGDNLDILREYIASNSVDLVYLDPPFNSSRNYKCCSRTKVGNTARRRSRRLKTRGMGGHRRAHVQRVGDRRAGSDQRRGASAAYVRGHEPDDGVLGDDDGALGGTAPRAQIRRQSIHVTSLSNACLLCVSSTATIS